MGDFGTDSGISFGREITRKLVHLSSLWMAALIFFWRGEQIFLFYFFGACFILNILCEHAYSLHVPVIRPVYGFLFGKMLRKDAPRGAWIVSGSPPVFAAAALVSLLFPSFIAAISLGVMLVADTAAALIGRRFGKHRLCGSKTLEGTLAFIAAGTAFALLLLAFAGALRPVTAAGALAGVVCAALAELYRDVIRLDDNLTIPLLCGAVMSAFYLFFC